MRRFLPLLLALSLGAVVRADDKPAPAPIDPAEVARLLLSPDLEKQTLAQDLLLERMRRGGDLGPFVRDLTAALRGSAADAEIVTATLLKQAVSGTAEERTRAVRLLAAVGPSAVGRILDELARTKGSESHPVPVPAAPVAEPPAPPPSPPQPAIEQIREVEDPQGEANDTVDGPAWRVTVHAVEAPAKDSDTLVVAGAARVGTAEEATAWAERARLLPDARRLGIDWEKGDDVLVGTDKARDLTDLIGGARSYRKSLAQTRDGAWAVVTGRLQSGYGLRARVTPAGSGLHVDLTPRYTEVGSPIPVVTVSPAPNVGLVELDRPEWTTSSVSVSFDLPGPKGGALVRADGLGKDSGRTLLLVLTISPR